MKPTKEEIVKIILDHKKIFISTHKNLLNRDCSPLELMAWESGVLSGLSMLGIDTKEIIPLLIDAEFNLKKSIISPFSSLL